MKLKYLALSALLGAALGTAQAALAQSVPTVSTTDITTAGLTNATGMQNAATSTYFANNGETLFVVDGGPTAVTATFKTQATTISQNGYGTTTLSDVAVTIPSSSVVVMGPFPTGRWNNQYGLVGVSFTAVTGVSATAINVPQ
ncbi:hypothetical protein ELG78_09270 [Rhizobium leguminosarum]|uniref:hypothetical protein n=1 Tax=Rhizobium leguminosarum TaxID=384 RepID=UPI001031A8E2|nr:hypothetical protein [Rhizobium leguminosarum]TBG37159.1 hypothetical protein ELG78_09270 [Rhizobium leguminosarum]